MADRKLLVPTSRVSLERPGIAVIAVLDVPYGGLTAHDVSVLVGIRGRLEQAT